MSFVSLAGVRTADVSLITKDGLGWTGFFQLAPRCHVVKYFLLSNMFYSKAVDMTQS